MALKRKYEEMADNIIEGKEKPTVNNINERGLEVLLSPPKKKKKRKAQKRSDKRKVDKRLKIWTRPREHATQVGYFTKRAKTRRASIRRYMFNLLFQNILWSQKKDRNY